MSVFITTTATVMWWKEKVFIPSTESYEFLKEDLGNTHLCKTKTISCFCCLHRSCNQVDIETGNLTGSGKKESKQNHFVVSDTKAHAAWLIESGDDAGKIREIEFDSTENKRYFAGKAEKI